MMRSMYSAVSGLRVHQTKMDVIGNNIANVNTVGYKKQSVSFQEVFSQVVRGASAPQDGRGGTNPQQIGLGVNIGAINTIHTKGAAQRTDNPEDLMIDGEGYFVVSADPNYENRYYTRAGNFTLDSEGNLVNADGYKVLGYTIGPDGTPTDTVSPIQINRSETSAPTATSEIEFRGNLDSRVEDGSIHKSDTIIKDSLGNSYTVTFRFVKKGTIDIKNDNGDVSGTGTEWTISIERITDQATGNYIDFYDDEVVDKDGNVTPDDDINKHQLLNDVNSLSLAFDKNGKLVFIGENTDPNNPTVTEGDFSNINLNLSGLEFNKEKDGSTTSAQPAGNFGENGLISLFDKEDKDTIISKLTQYANEMDAKPYAGGNSSGKLEGYTIDSSGVVLGIFTNGERKALAQIMLAKFDNPMGLQKMGSNLFVDSRNSGEPQYGVAGSGGYGSIAPGTLEMSNVDLANEFTEMITTQRGFQANSRVITSSDEMLQELINMKR